MNRKNLFLIVWVIISVLPTTNLFAQDSEDLIIRKNFISKLSTINKQFISKLDSIPENFAPESFEDYSSYLKVDDVDFIEIENAYSAMIDLAENYLLTHTEQEFTNLIMTNPVNGDDTVSGNLTCFNSWHQAELSIGVGMALCCVSSGGLSCPACLGVGD